MTPLQLAAKNGMIGVVLTLIALGARLDDVSCVAPQNPSKLSQKPSLYLAMENQHWLAAQILLSLGANKKRSMDLAYDFHDSDTNDALASLTINPCVFRGLVHSIKSYPSLDGKNNLLNLLIPQIQSDDFIIDVDHADSNNLHQTFLRERESIAFTDVKEALQALTHFASHKEYDTLLDTLTHSHPSLKQENSALYNIKTDEESVNLFREKTFLNEALLKQDSDLLFHFMFSTHKYSYEILHNLPENRPDLLKAFIHLLPAGEQQGLMIRIIAQDKLQLQDKRDDQHKKRHGDYIQAIGLSAEQFTTLYRRNLPADYFHAERINAALNLHAQRFGFILKNEYYLTQKNNSNPLLKHITDTAQGPGQITLNFLTEKERSYFFRAAKKSYQFPQHNHIAKINDFLALVDTEIKQQSFWKQRDYAAISKRQAASMVSLPVILACWIAVNIKLTEVIEVSNSEFNKTHTIGDMSDFMFFTFISVVLGMMSLASTFYAVPGAYHLGKALLKENRFDALPLNVFSEDLQQKAKILFTFLDANNNNLLTLNLSVKEIRDYLNETKKQLFIAKAAKPSSYFFVEASHAPTNRTMPLDLPVSIAAELKLTDLEIRCNMP